MALLTPVFVFCLWLGLVAARDAISRAIGFLRRSDPGVGDLPVLVLERATLPMT